MSLFFTLYHSIIVSRKDISYSGPFIYPGFFKLCHYFSLHIIVSSYHKKYILPWACHIPRIFYIMSLFFTLYHSIIILQKNISYAGPFIYLRFFILLLFSTSYHSIIVSQKNISYSGPFTYLGFLYYVIIFHFVS